MYANILTIAGSDSGGGAGVQADLKTFSATGAYGLSVITALTAQNTVGVKSIYPVSKKFLRQQLESVSSDIRIDAVKIGMLGTPEVIEVVSKFISVLSCPVVLDPVMVAKSGDRLLHAESVRALREVLIPNTTLITPNLPEAADLLITSDAGSRADMEIQAEGLLKLGSKAVLLKGGHLGTEESPDLLVNGEVVEWLESKRFHTRNTHGSGCSLSSALASFLGQGHSVVQSVSLAKAYMMGAIENADRLTVGEGNGPVHHFWKIW